MASYSSAFRAETITFTSTLAIIGISVHGVIIHDRPIIPMPRGIDMAKMNFVMPSVCSFIDDEGVQRCNDTIITEVNKTPGLERQNVYDLCKSLTDKITPFLLTSIENMGDYLKSATVEGIVADEGVTVKDAKADIERRQAFKHGADRAIRIFSTTKGITHMINKSYIRDTSRDLENPYGDWQMKLLNHPDQPDLIPDIYKFIGKRYTRSESEITLEQLLAFLISKGIKKVIIFDYSCSNITDVVREDIATTETGRRNLARNAQIGLDLSKGTLGYGGKKKGTVGSFSNSPFYKKLKRKKTVKKRRKKLTGGMRSSRRQTTPLIPTKSIGTTGHRVTSQQITNFVNNEIHDGLQIVSFPVPPERHAILVNIKNDKIMISDWGGEKMYKRGKQFIDVDESTTMIENPIYEERWKIYTEFIDELQYKYIDKNVEYYEIDPVLKEEANEHHRLNHEAGGCSYYIYAWLDKHKDEL